MKRFIHILSQTSLLRSIFIFIFLKIHHNCIFVKQIAGILARILPLSFNWQSFLPLSFLYSRIITCCSSIMFPLCCSSDVPIKFFCRSNLDIPVDTSITKSQGWRVFLLLGVRAMRVWHISLICPPWNGHSLQTWSIQDLLHLTFMWWRFRHQFFLFVFHNKLNKNWFAEFWDVKYDTMCVGYTVLTPIGCNLKIGCVCVCVCAYIAQTRLISTYQSSQSLFRHPGVWWTKRVRVWVLAL